MAEVVRLEAPILQVRTLAPGDTLGYGAAHAIARPTRIATLAVGYADGYPRSLSNRGFACLAGQRVAVVGRVSMDLLMLDVGAVPESLAQVGADVALVGGGVDCDELAAAGGSIAYELFTRLGPRFERVYLSRANMASMPSR